MVRTMKFHQPRLLIRERKTPARMGCTASLGFPLHPLRPAVSLPNPLLLNGEAESTDYGERVEVQTAERGTDCRERAEVQTAGRGTRYRDCRERDEVETAGRGTRYRLQGEEQGRDCRERDEI